MNPTSLDEFLRTHAKISGLRKTHLQHLEELHTLQQRLKILQACIDVEETRYRNMELSPEDLRKYRNWQMKPTQDSDD